MKLKLLMLRNLITFSNKGFIPLFIMLLLLSCKQRNDFTPIDNNLFVKCIVKNKKQVPVKIGDYIRVSMQYTTLKDSVFFDTRKELTPIWIPIMPATYEGDIMKGLMLMHVGDSCHFKVRTDSFYIRTMGYRQLPPDAPSDSFMIIRLKVLDVKSKNEFEAERKIIEENLRKQYEELKQEEAVKLKAYLEAHQIKQIPLPSGLYYIPIKPGKGKKPVPGQKVLVSYEATFIDGQLFDKTNPYQPLQVVVGSPDLIEGFNLALLSMREGETATWIIPSSKAYGKSSMDSPVPPYATLIFTITLHQILP